jgi:hypothetical protein
MSNLCSINRLGKSFGNDCGYTKSFGVLSHLASLQAIIAWEKIAPRRHRVHRGITEVVSLCNLRVLRVSVVKLIIEDYKHKV